MRTSPAIEMTGGDIEVSTEFEDGCWVAESEQMPSLFAGGSSRDEAMTQAIQAIRDVKGPAPTILFPLWHNTNPPAFPLP